MANRLLGQAVNMGVSEKGGFSGVFFWAGEIMIHHQVLGYSIFGKSIPPKNNLFQFSRN